MVLATSTERRPCKQGFRQGLHVAYACTVPQLSLPSRSLARLTRRPVWRHLVSVRMRLTFRGTGTLAFMMTWFTGPLHVCSDRSSRTRGASNAPTVKQGCTCPTVAGSVGLVRVIQR